MKMFKLKTHASCKYRIKLQMEIEKRNKRFSYSVIPRLRKFHYLKVDNFDSRPILGKQMIVDHIKP